MSAQMKAYAAVAIIYGSTRKTFHVWDAQVSNFYNYEAKDQIYRPLLWTEKTALIGIAGISSIYLWPFYLYNDVFTLESHFRKIPLTRHRKPNYYLHSMDCLFC
jgi:hypothetical protein